MRLKLIYIITLLSVILSCKKDEKIFETNDQVTSDSSLTIIEAKGYIKNKAADTSTILKKLKIDWSLAIKNGRRWVVPLNGQPTYQNYKQGYRELSIYKNAKTQSIEAHILEIIPDAIYLQKVKRSNTRTFTGRVFEHDLHYKLIGGRLYSDGKPVGNIKQLSDSERLQNANNHLHEPNPFSGIQGKQMRMMAIETCSWIDDYYIDAEGDFTIHSTQLCSTTYFDDGGGGGGYDGVGGNGGISSPSEGGGSGSTGNSSPPPPSNLPGENNNIVDPKKMMDCFSQITTPNAAFVIRVYVVEPQPGTSFNVGANSFGHVAISLSKTSGTTNITQTIGLYPTGTGFDKLSSKSQIIDNGFDEYDMSATFYVSGESFQKVINYLSNPPANYHFTDYNCSAYVYGAGQAGGIPIPDPTTQIGIAGPGGAGFAKTPAGMASALREQKSNNPSSDINEGGGQIPSSKGECK